LKSIFVNDISGSMTSTDAKPTESFIVSKHNNRVGALYEASYHFLKKREGTTDIVSCLLHDSETKEIFSYQPVSSKLVDHMLLYPARGGNNFKKAMLAVQNVISRDKSGLQPIVLFMTDGEMNEDGASEILESMMKTYAHTGITLNSICLGNSCNDALMSKFATIGKGKFSKSGMNVIELKAVYESFADALILK
jgi:hypothetical protein